MAAEDEAVGLVIKVGDTVVQGASELFMLILRALAEAQRQRAAHLAQEGREGIVMRSVHGVTDKVADALPGHGKKGLVSVKVANSDEESFSYRLGAGVLTTGELDSLSRQFTMRNLSIAITEGGKRRGIRSTVSGLASPETPAGEVEFFVPRGQRDQFLSALASVAPNANLDEAHVRAEGQRRSEDAPSPALSGGAGSTLDAAKVLEGREDLAAMCRELNRQGASVMFSRDPKGLVEVTLKGPNGADLDSFAESVKVAALAYGLDKNEVEATPIRRDSHGNYPGSFTFLGLSFERSDERAGMWAAKDDRDPRIEIFVGVDGKGRPSYEISRNGRLSASSSSQDENVFLVADQPLESAVLGAVSALDRARRTEERAAAEEQVTKRGKALSGTAEKRAEGEALAAPPKNAELRAREMRAKDLARKSAATNATPKIVVEPSREGGPRR